MEVAAAYDARAEEYAARFGSVGRAAPEDRAEIEAWAADRSGPVLDAGCGPGHWTDLLQHHQDHPVVGVDSSRRLLRLARRRFRALDLVQARLEALPFEDATFDGVLAWFSLVHTPPDDLDTCLAELARVLRPTGRLLVGYFEGRPGADFPHAVTTGWTWSADELSGRLAEHGLGVERRTQRHDDGQRPVGTLTARRSDRTAPTAATRRGAGR